MFYLFVFVLSVRAGLNNGAFDGCSITHIEIPDCVTTIGEGAFSGCCGLVSVTIGKNVTAIGEGAFGDCNKILEILNYSDLPIAAGSLSILYGGVALYAKHVCTNPEDRILVQTEEGYFFYETEEEHYLLGYCGNESSLTLPEKSPKGSGYAIYDGAFRQGMDWLDESITSIKISDGVTSIGNRAFEDCCGLKRITIGNNVTQIGNKVFDGCNSFEEIIVDEGNSVYSSQDRILYNKEKTEILQVPWAIKGAVTIPDGVTSIERSVFEWRRELTHVTLGNGVQTIGEDAFYQCGLESITFGRGVTTIAERAFESCLGLSKVFIPDLSVWCMIDFADGGANPLNYAQHLYWQDSGEEITELKISGITEIKKCAFWNCKGLTSVTIGDDVTTIGEEAFCRCTGLESITIGSGVTKIGGGAFDNTAYFNDPTHWDESGVLYIGNYLIDALSTISGNYTIHADTTVIADYAFYFAPWNESRLTGIEIPDSVTAIGDSAFAGRIWLEIVMIGSGVTTIGRGAFSGCDNLKTVYYKGTSEMWDRITYSLGNWNDRLTSATRYYFTEDEPTEEEWAAYLYYWHYDETTNEPTPWVKKEA